MLTIAPLRSPQQAINYFHSYYANDGYGQGAWFGKGATLLNLTGKVALTDFQASLEGKLSPIITMPATTEHRRPGYDLTFSAPKSVSILALVGDDPRILAAHRTAVNQALAYLEKNFAATRMKVDGKINVAKTDNLLIAKFEHIESRALDPELHTHAIVMNATLRPDKAWRTLYFDWVYDNKMLLGVIYRGELAQALMQLGYEITQTSEKGLFELKDFSPEMIKLQSKRREQIVNELKQQGFTSSKAAQIANFSTRDHKINLDPAALKLSWQQELVRHGFSLTWCQEYIKQAKERGPVTPVNPYKLAVQAVTKSAKELSNWRGVFTYKELLKHAGWLTVGNCSPMILEKVIAEQFKSGELLALTKDLCTTQTARDLEILNILNMRQGKNKIFAMFSGWGATFLVQKITDPQVIKGTIRELLVNTDQQIVVTAQNATNYTATMQAFVDLSYKYGFYPLGITQTVVRKKELAEELKLNRTQTIEGFLLSCAKRAAKIQNQPISPYRLLNAKQIWILDLHSSISSKQLNALQGYAKQFGTRIIWANKINKPQVAINALLKHGIKECCLEGQQAIEPQISALMCHPLPNAIDLTNNHIEKTNWQTNTANSLVHWVISHNQQHDAVFSLKKLQLELFSLGITVPKEVLQAELDRASSQGLIPIHKELVTTNEQLGLEECCLKLVIANQKTIDPIARQIVLPNKLTTGQQNAIKLILTTTDRVVGIQGVAGSGKTTMLRSLHKLCQAANFQVIAITPTTSARERLPAEIKAMTVRQFLIASEKLLHSDLTLAKLEYGVNKLIVLDEASFVSTAEMFAVLTKVVQLNARLVVVGDNRQLCSVEAGNILYLMLGSYMQSVAMTENVRFKSLKALEVMQHIYQNQLPEALVKLTDSLVEIPDLQERLSQMVALYLAKTPEERLKTILITPEHTERKLVNEAIRQGLKQAKQLVGPEISCYNLTQVSLTKAAQQKIYYFKEQDLVVFSKAPAAFQVTKGRYYLITAKNLDHKTLSLQDPSTKTQIIWSPEKTPCHMQVYRQEERLLMANDQIRWLKNSDMGICNGQTAKITAINQNQDANILLQNGAAITLNLKEFTNQHWDHAYAATTFVAQGADQPMTIALAKGGYSKEILSKDIKVGDVLVTKEVATIDHNICYSKLVKVTAINKDRTALAQDRDGNNLTLNLKKSPTNNYAKGQAIWHSYPNPQTRKKDKIPKLTSVGEFLVSVTRGDQVTLLVDHIESYQHALEQRIWGARSALEYLDPDRDQVRAKVAHMTSNITGTMVQEPCEASTPLANQVKNSLYNKQVAFLDPDLAKDMAKGDSTSNHLDLLPEQLAERSAPTAIKTKNSLYHNYQVTVEQVIDKLHQRILGYATDWLGRAQKVTRDEARWGKKGSLVVKLTGHKAGYWHDFENGVGGKNLLSLYIERINPDFKTAMQELASLLQLDSAKKLFTKPATIVTSSKLKKVTTPDLKKIAYANKVYHSGVPIAGTLAEQYLREFRGITGFIPSDFRFCAKLKHPDLQRFVPALLAPIRNSQNEIQGVVRIFLNQDGKKLNATYLDADGRSQKATVKANLGAVVNAAVTINNGDKASTIYLAEGIETALSIATAQPTARILAALSVSNLKNVPLLNNTRKIVLCADYDGMQAASHQALLTAADYYQACGLEVLIAYPAKVPGLAKVDFNDVLKHLGVKAINQALQAAAPATELKMRQDDLKITELNNFLPNKTASLNKELTR